MQAKNSCESSLELKTEGGEKMTIHAINGKQLSIRYHIEDNNESIAYFDSLYTAGCVLRFLKGAPMLAEDVREARQAMQEFDRKHS